MISETTRSRNPAGHAGLLQNLLALASAGISWLWTALMAAGAHFIIALALLLVARSRMTKPLFRATVSELKKDHEWLKNLDATDQPAS